MERWLRIVERWLRSDGYGFKWSDGYDILALMKSLVKQTDAEKDAIPYIIQLIHIQYFRNEEFEM